MKITGATYKATSWEVIKLAERHDAALYQPYSTSGLNF